MNRYEIAAQIGDGTFGRVFKATLKETGAVVAIKQIKKKMKSFEESISLREIQSLSKLSHPNIVSMREMMFENDGSLYFVFEFMPDGSLYELMKRCIETKTTLSNDQVASYMVQLFNALSFLHSEKAVFHRDIKPENILCSGNVIKLADFGLCRDVSSNPPFTYYVSTRWYRAPEVILHSLSYGPPIDLFAAGLILAELYSLRPLLPGSSEIDQIHLMTKLLGPPNDWDEGVDHMQRMKLAIPVNSSSPDRNAVELRIQQMLPRDVPLIASNLIASLLSWNPHHRPSAHECIQHDLFRSQSTAREEEQMQSMAPSTVKRSNTSNERKTKREELNSTLAQREAKKLPFSLKTSRAESTHGDDGNEFSDYLAAVSNSSHKNAFTSSSASTRTGNKIRPLLFEKENRSFPEESLQHLPSNDDMKIFQMNHFGNPKSIRKVRGKSRNQKSRGYHRNGEILPSALGRGIGVQINNNTLPEIANIWDKEDEKETNTLFEENEFRFK